MAINRTPGCPSGLKLAPPGLNPGPLCLPKGNHTFLSQKDHIVVLLLCAFWLTPRYCKYIHNDKFNLLEVIAKTHSNVCCFIVNHQAQISWNISWTFPNVGDVWTNKHSILSSHWVRMKTRFPVFWQFVSWLLFIKCHYGLLIRAIGNSSTDLHCSLSLPMFCISHNLICVPQDQFPSKLWQEMNMVIENSCITGKSSFHLSVECFLEHLPYCTWWRFLWNNIQMGSDIKPEINIRCHNF